MGDGRFLLAIPVYNEERYLAGVLGQARAYLDDVLIVDDGSQDRTPQILAAYPDLPVIRHVTNLGYGRSRADAFAFAIEAGFDWLITMDCDGQHEPEFIPKFMAAARRDDADLISGSRYLSSFDGDSLPPADRRWINARITCLLNDRLGLGITDAFCGFKAYRVAALGRLSVTEPGYAMPLQVWVQAARAGMRIVELPVRLIYRDATRRFGGGLDDPEARYRYYTDVLEAELGRCAWPVPPPDAQSVRIAS